MDEKEKRIRQILEKLVRGQKLTDEEKRLYLYQSFQDGDEKMSGKKGMYEERKTGDRVFKNAYTDRINEAIHKIHVLRVEEAKINASISDMADEINMEFERFKESVRIGDKVDILSSIDDAITSGVVVETGSDLMESYFMLSTEHGYIRVSGKVNPSVVWAKAREGDE
jgi:hypothetical protein